MEQTHVKKSTWKSTVAGILDLAAAAWHFVLMLVVVAFGLFAAVPVGSRGFDARLGVFVVVGLTVLLMIAAVLSVIGGVSALRKKRWGWALTGAIAALFPGNIFGVAAVVFTALARDEFEK
jgi:hypothetical protein